MFVEEFKTNNNEKEIALWQRYVADGDESALAYIYEKFSRKMYAYGRAIGFCGHLCKDAVHDVFYTVVQSKNNLKDIKNIEAYFLGSVRNRLFRIFRERKIESSDNYDSLISEPIESPIDEIISHETQLLMKEEINRLSKKLNSKQRKIVQYRIIQNLKFDEIAKKMDMTSDAVKKQFYRSLIALEPERERISSKLLQFS